MSGNVHNNDGFNRTGIKLILLSVCSWAIFSFTCMNAYSVWVPAVADKIGMDFADLNMWNTYGGLIAAVATFAASHIVRKFGSRKTLFVSLGIWRPELPVHSEMSSCLRLLRRGAERGSAGILWEHVDHSADEELVSEKERCGHGMGHCWYGHRWFHHASDL